MNDHVITVELDFTQEQLDEFIVDLEEKGYKIHDAHEVVRMAIQNGQLADGGETITSLGTRRLSDPNLLETLEWQSVVTLNV